MLENSLSLSLTQTHTHTSGCVRFTILRDLSNDSEIKETWNHNETPWYIHTKFVSGIFCISTRQMPFVCIFYRHWCVRMNFNEIYDEIQHVNVRCIDVIALNYNWNICQVNGSAICNNKMNFRYAIIPLKFSCINIISIGNEIILKQTLYWG